MQGLDMSIDEARAKIWMDDVNAELQNVRITLKKVQQANTEVAGSDDTIMEGIYQVGTLMGNAWDKMCNFFDEAQSKVGSVLDKIRNAVSNVVDEVNTVKSKY